jgi:hypothetical protein
MIIHVILYSCSITKLNRLKRLLKTSFITVCLKRVFLPWTTRIPPVDHAYSSRGPRVFLPWTTRIPPVDHAYSSRGPRVFLPWTTRIRPVDHAYSSRGPRVFVPWTTRIPPVDHAYSSRGPRVVQVLTTRNKREKETLGHIQLFMLFQKIATENTFLFESEFRASKIFRSQISRSQFKLSFRG